MILYFDAFHSGCSGDMILGALVDAGAPFSKLEAAVRELGLEGVELRPREVRRAGLRATLVEVEVRREPFPSLAAMAGLLQDRAPDSWARRQALQALQWLEEAEARVHGVPVEGTHPHELGSADTLIDLYGSFLLMEALGATAIHASPLPAARGTVEMSHGRYPLPAPVTLEILARVNAPLVPAPEGPELVTPTGSVILASAATFEQPSLTLGRIGYGAGQKELPWPNVLRLWLGAPALPEGSVVLLETNVDDSTGEELGDVLELLLEAGALDAYFTPITMKKSRPAVKLSVLARPGQEEALARLILGHTSSFGLRVAQLRRFEAERRVEEVWTEFGSVRMKLKLVEGELVEAKPEYEDCRHLARQRQVPLSRIYRLAQEAFWGQARV